MNKNKRVAVFYYEGFAEFEISLALLYLRKYELITVAMEKKTYVSLSGQRFIVDALLEDLDPLSIALFLIPGGDPIPYLANKELHDFIEKASSNGAVIAGICGGADMLISMGFFEEKACTGNPDDPNHPQQLIDCFSKTKVTNEPVVVDGNFITAQGSAFVEFASVLVKEMQVEEKDLTQLGFDWLPSVNHWTDVSRSIKVSTSSFEMCNMTLIVSEGDAMLVDTGYRKKEAERIYKYIEANHLVLKTIVLTHFHEDHIANVSMFKTPSMSVYDPKTVTQDIHLNVGSKKIRLFKTPGHHQDGDISVEVVDEHILLSGDALYSCLPPQLSYGAQPDQLKKSIEMIAKQHYDWIVPGHGRVMSGDEITKMALNYISLVEKRVSDVVEKNGCEDDLQHIHLYECITHYEWMISEPSIDLHRQNKLELFRKLSNNV